MIVVPLCVYHDEGTYKTTKSQLIFFGILIPVIIVSYFLKMPMQYVGALMVVPPMFYYFLIPLFSIAFKQIRETYVELIGSATFDDEAIVIEVKGERIKAEYRNSQVSLFGYVGVPDVGSTEWGGGNVLSFPNRKFRVYLETIYDYRNLKSELLARKSKYPDFEVRDYIPPLYQ